MKIRSLLPLTCALLAHSTRSAAQTSTVQVITAQAVKTQTAAAQTVPSDLCDRSEECKRLSSQARELGRAGKHEEAILMYRAAYTIAPAPWLLYNLARRLESAGHQDEAAAVYLSYLERGTNERVEHIQKARAYLAHLRSLSIENKGPIPAVQGPSVGDPRPEPARGMLPDSSRTAPVHKKGLFNALLGIGSFSVAALGIVLCVYGGRKSDEPQTVTLTLYGN